MSGVNLGIPRRALDWCHAHGTLHNDCVVAGPPSASGSGGCSACTNLIYRGMHAIYGHLGPHEATAQLLRDLKEEIL